MMFKIIYSCGGLNTPTFRLYQGYEIRQRYLMRTNGTPMLALGFVYWCLSAVDFFIEVNYENRSCWIWKNGAHD